MQTRRILPTSGVFGFTARPGRRWPVGAPRAAEAFPVTDDDVAWRTLATPDRYAVNSVAMGFKPESA